MVHFAGWGGWEGGRVHTDSYSKGATLKEGKHRAFKTDCDWIIY